MNPFPTIWTTRAKAAEYLVESVDNVDRRLIPLADNPAPVTGKIRFRILPPNQLDGTPRQVRLLSADVLAVLPLPQEATA